MWTNNIDLLWVGCLGVMVFLVVLVVGVSKLRMTHTKTLNPDPYFEVEVKVEGLEH